MKFGYFDDQNKEYVITTPETPYPWINYLGSQDFFGLFSNTAGGYAFYKDARLRRLTRYRYNNVPVDNEGRYFYLRDGDTLWSPAWKPTCTPLDHYECRHGMGYSVIESVKNNLKARHTAFVPLETNAEVHQLVLTNQSEETKKIDLFSYLEFCLWDAYDDMTNFQRNFNIGEVEVEGSTIYHKTEYRERRDHYAFYTVNHPLAGYDTNREDFIGLYHGVNLPDAVRDGQSRNSQIIGWSPIASHHLEIELAAGESRSLIFLLGYIENARDDKWSGKLVINKKKAHELQARFETDAQVESALADLKTYWDQLLSCYNVETEEAEVNRMVNIWNAYQCMVTFNMSRSASYFESGVGRGMGFRDSNQDILGFVHQVPERARERLLDLAATQMEDGGAYHQYQPLTKKGNLDVGGGFYDDPLWLILATADYIKETGDLSILEEMVPFDNRDDLAQPMLEHLKRSFDHVINHLGPHGLPLIGRADWNDCLNLNCWSENPGESFQAGPLRQDMKTAESVLIAGMFAYIGPDYAGICRLLGQEEEARRAEDEIARMRQTVLSQGYDGDWFLRAYDAMGEKIGSSECDEGKIFIEPQGMCVMGRIGVETGEAEKALDSAQNYLDTPYGMVLNNPCYTGYRINLGEISTYPGGYKENASVFCHNNPWVACAETVLGRGDRAFEIYRKICPAYLEDISDLHRTEPYVYAQTIAGKDALKPGEAKNSWLTGTASYNFVAITQWILGVKPQFDGLQVNPCIPSRWNGFKVKRICRGVTYHINVKNPDHVCKGVAAMTVDGQPVDGFLVPYATDKKDVQVDVVLG